MPIQSYDPSVFIQRIETTGSPNVTREIVVNETTPLKVADSVNILGNDYLIENIDETTKTITLDKDRDANIDLVATPTIEVKHKVADPNISLDTPVAISDTERKEKLIALGKDLYQRILNKQQEILGTDFYGMREQIESETRAYLGTFNEDNTPILALLASQEGVKTREVALRFKEKVVEENKARAVLISTFINLAIKVKQAQSKKELDSISFV